MIRTIIFDMDGVIFDTERLDRDCWIAVAIKYGLPNIEATLEKCIGTNTTKTKEIFLETYGPDADVDGFRAETSALFHGHTEKYGMPEKSGVVPLMKYLKENGFRIGLGSSTRTDTVKRQLAMSDYLKYFDVVVGGDMVSRSKPEPDVFLLCASILGAEPEKTYVIEDSYNGIRAANTAGMLPIMVPDLILPNEEMRAKCVAILPNLLEVKKYLMKQPK